MKFSKLLLPALFVFSGQGFSQDLQTVTGNGNTTNQLIIIDPAADAFRGFYVKRLNGTVTSQVGLANNKTSGNITWHPDAAAPGTTYSLNVGANLLTYYNNGTTETIWRSGNMGTGSGLNADLLDGVNSSALFRYGTPNMGDPTAYAYPGPGVYLNTTFQPANGIPNNNYGAYIYLGALTGDGNYNGMIAMGTNNGNVYTKRRVAGAWETSWRTIWDSNNFNPASYLPLTGGSITGDIAIGTTAAQKELNVNGNITARKVKVTLTGWPDYVFDHRYELMPLQQLGAYIAANKHLPGVPSAETVMQEGLELGENQAVLLTKIEELTLYILEQNKKQEALEQKLLEMEKKLNAR
ncbi:hypothetical protein [Chitinophaga sp. YIM B06452]|uniref:hypothetical protein n=1 Tax=Chitinophaga sp. YIM B06452 TaxID=3082158 RepID=UPI0031FF2A46